MAFHGTKTPGSPEAIQQYVDRDEKLLPTLLFVIPAKAWVKQRIQTQDAVATDTWIPAFARMTEQKLSFSAPL